MKRFVKIYTYWLLGMLLFTGCDDYLKEDSGDLLIPGKVDEFLPMLYKEGSLKILMRKLLGYI